MANKSSPPWRAGVHSARALLGPGLLLQSIALALVLAYYFVPATHAVFTRVGEWQRDGGYWFSSGAAVLCGALLPFLFLRLHPDTRAAHPWAHLPFFVLYWVWKGAEVDLWYRVLSWWHGGGHDAVTITRKVLSDQFGFNPLYATPVSLVLFAWKDAGFRWAPVSADLRAGRWYYRRVLPVLLPLWSVWLPVVACVYALPQPLQMPLFNVVLCFWAMLFGHITTRHAASGKPET